MDRRTEKLHIEVDAPTKNKLKSPAKTMVFVSSREKSDKSGSTLLSVCSCSV